MLGCSRYVAYVQSLSISQTFSRTCTDQPMPTKKRRYTVIPENLPSQLPDERGCPAVATAEQLFTRRPGDYRSLVSGIAEGEPTRSLKRRLKVSDGTIAIVRQRESGLIESSRTLLRGLTAIAAQATLEKFLERLDQDKIPDGVLPIACGIFLDKVARDAGEATQTIEVRKSVSLEQVREELEEMKRATPA